MGNSQTIRKINFEDMQTATRNPEIYLIINTLPSNEQNCLIVNTISIDEEETIINEYMTKPPKDIRIKKKKKNCNDECVNNKYKQLQKLGFNNIFIYLGGLFEWLMLQDIYGKELFLTTKNELDILRFKPSPLLNVALIGN